MLSKDLMLTQNLIVYEDLKELLTSLEEYVDHYNNTLEEYGDRLGSLLRQQKSGTAVGQSVQVKSETKKDGGQKRGGEKEPWTVVKLDNDGNVSLRVANTSVLSPATAESTVLFKVIESLKDRVRYLDAARKALSELPSKGVRFDQRFLVSFAEGLPRQVIPTNRVYSAEKRFRYSGEFELRTMDES